MRGGADCWGSLRAGESAAQLNSMLDFTVFLESVLFESVQEVRRPCLTSCTS